MILSIMMAPRASLAQRQPLQNATEHQSPRILDNTGISVQLCVLAVLVQLGIHWSDKHSIL